MERDNPFEIATQKKVEKEKDKIYGLTLYVRSRVLEKEGDNKN